MYMSRTACICRVLHVYVLYFMYISRSPCVLSVFIVNVYMPTTNVSIDHYRESIADLKIIVDWLSDDGIILMCGDFNGQLGGQCGPISNSFTNVRGSVLYDFIYDCMIIYNNMFSSITQESCFGPVYTCWPGHTSYNPSQIDHFIISYDFSQCIEYSVVMMTIVLIHLTTILLRLSLNAS